MTRYLPMTVHVPAAVLALIVAMPAAALDPKPESAREPHATRPKITTYSVAPPCGLPRPDAAALPPNSAQPCATELSGSWQLSITADAESCTVMLDRVDPTHSYGSVIGLACPAGFHQLVAWRLNGFELEFLSPTGRVIARLSRTGDGHWQGQRENDGAIILMAPAADEGSG